MSISTLEDFHILSTLGQGSYGLVYKVERLVLNKTNIDNKNSKKQKKKKKKVYVMKQIQLQQMTKEEQYDAVNECKIMASLSNKYIVKYYDSFIDKTTLNIIMEYCNKGDLQQYLSNHSKRNFNNNYSSTSHLHTVDEAVHHNNLLSENVIWKFLLEMASGLYYLHTQKILHRDMKTANIFLSSSSNSNNNIKTSAFGQHNNDIPSLKIGDLGVAKMLNSTKSYAASVVGTPYYLSPELCANKPYNKQSDVWALGCILYECCTFKHPFDATNQGALVLKIMRGKYEPICMDYSHDLRILVKDMLIKDMKKRLTLNKLFNRKCVIDKSKELNMDIPFIESKGKEYLKYMKVTNDGGDGNEKKQHHKFTLNKGNHNDKLAGNIRGGRVRGRTQTRILAALPTEMINNNNNNSGGSNSNNNNNKSPPLKRIKNVDQQQQNQQRRKWKTDIDDVAVPILKKSQMKYQRNNYLKLGSKANENGNNSRRPTVKELRALMMEEEEVEEEDNNNSKKSDNEGNYEDNVENNNNNIKAQSFIATDNILVDDVELDDDIIDDDDVVEEKIQEHDCVIKEGKENNNNDDDDTNNNTLEDEDEIIPIYNTHCVLLNDDTEGEDLVEYEVNSKEEEQVIVVEDDKTINLRNENDQSQYEGKYQVMMDDDNVETTIKTFTNDDDTGTIETYNNDVDNLTIINKNNSSVDDEEDDNEEEEEEEENNVDDFSRTLTFRGVDYKVL